MGAEQVMGVTVAVVLLTQLFKWMRVISDQYGPLSVLGLAALGVGLWALSFEDTFRRQAVWSYFVAWINVSVSAAGVYGFTRAASEAITSTRTPPAGAAQNVTENARSTGPTS